MRKHDYTLAALLALLLLALPGRAQYATAVQDGNITPNEYSGNVFPDSNNPNWYMTWDATNLYVAKTGGQSGEPVLLYLDLDPTLPVTGGGNANGNVLGVSDYEVVPTLPFRADTRVKFTSTTVEVQRLTGGGGWDTPTTTGLFVFSTGTNREVRLSWATLRGGSVGVPPSFNWLGYEVSTGLNTNNYRYDQAPLNALSQNNSGGASPLIEYYFTVASTATSVATNPFRLRSYTYPGPDSSNNFGGIDVWDFTMNTPDKQIARSQGDWQISGSLVVGNGRVFFGNSSQASSFGATNVGNIRVTGTGLLSMDATDKLLTVQQDVDLRGGQFLLSGRQGGDLTVGRNFLVTNGISTPATFQPNGRAVTFTGNSVAHLIQSTNSAPGYIIPFSYLTLNTPGQTVTLNSNIFVISQLNFTNGNLVTGSNVVDLDGGAQLTPEQTNSYLIGQVRTTQFVGGGGSGTSGFGSMGFSLTPLNSSPGLGNITVTRTTGTALTGVGSSGNSTQRYFSVAGPGLGATNLDMQLQVGYRLDELNGISEQNLALYVSATGAAPYARLSTPPPTNVGNHTITVGLTTLTSGTTFAFGEGNTPLPVTLVSFGATPTAQGAALLRWVTATELNNRGFGIERQLGGGAWQPVGYVAASGRPTGSTYEYLDKSLTSIALTTPLAYYRLRQEDQDGTVTYSPVAVVARRAPLAANALQLFPVPVTGASLSVALAEAGQAGLEVAVTNTQGQRLLHFTTEASPDAALSLPVAQLAAGAYIVTVRVPGQAVRHARFVKL